MFVMRERPFWEIKDTSIFLFIYVSGSRITADAEGFYLALLNQ
jgi:hypothetical protein